jgi:tetratricopeptide (TPR) repeat protein
MRIFLSSTYVDLKDYRTKARQAIEESGNEFVGMETFQSHTHEPSEFCPERVEECDALVLLVAYRYGNIPDGETRSITQLEYEHALKLKIPVRIYLTDDAFSCSPRVVDDNRGRINGFRTALSKTHTCSYFSTSEGLYEKLTADLKQFPVPPYTANPYALQANFTGRVAERSFLSDWLTKDQHPMLSLIAFGGMGKSALAWYWLMKDVKGSDEQPKKMVWWSFYDIESGFERFLKKAIEYFGDEEVDWDKLPSTRDRMEHLYTLLRDNRYLLVLDGVERVLRAYAGMGSPYQGDEIKEDERGDFRSCIEPHCSMFLQWLATGHPRTKTLLTSRLFPRELDELEGCVRKDLKRMDKDDAVEFFRRQGVKGARAEIEEACGAYNYHPLSLRLLSGMILKDMKYNGDIKAWTRHNPLPDLVPKEHHILDLAYDSLDKKKQAFISRLAAFRNPMDYDAISIFNDFGGEDTFNEVLLELVGRGMLFRDEKSNKFDLHPIVRRYCYERLKNKENIHSVLIDYFAYIPAPEKIESVDDLASVIELYHHTVRAGKYDEALNVYYNRIWHSIFYTFGAYQTEIELLRELFPDDEDKLPRLKKEEDQAWTLNELANSYSLSGQPRRAIPLVERQNAIREKRGDKKNLAIGLGNLASNLIRVGKLDAAETNLRRSIETSFGINDALDVARGHNELGLLLAYRGEFVDLENELGKALESFTNLKNQQSQGIVWAYRAIRSILMSNADEALNAAKKARELADVGKLERDIIQAEYLIGAAHLMKGSSTEAEKHITESLTRDRKINLVEFEPDILLEFAKLQFHQDHKPKALKQAEEALQIADRCESLLKQADIHHFLAEFYLDADNLEKAKAHAEIAKERAECGYKPALEKAENLREEIKRKVNKG